MDTLNIKGLSSEEVANKKKLGLSNEVIDSYTPSTFIILRRNIFSLINIVIFPLLITLVIYRRYTDVLAFATFLVINTLISILDETRNKKQLEKLKNEFQQKVIVIRDGKEEEIAAVDVVEGDFIKANEGEGVIADGEVVLENYLQIDESALNGESNYIRKDRGEKLYSGSFIITGSCVYKVLSVGKNNYLNKLGSEAVKLKEKRSQMQKNGDQLIIFLVVAAIVMGVVNFYASGLTNTPMEQRILGLTTVISLIIPQTLIFLFTLTFTISITKLYNKGILVQKGGSIEDLSNINVICFDKTGTITTNEMKLIKTKYFNITENEVGEFYNTVSKDIVSVNKTQEIINKFFSDKNKLQVTEFDQVPFTSKNKYSLVTAKEGSLYKTLIFGAYSMLNINIDSTKRNEIENYVKDQESQGNRVLVGLYYKTENRLIDTSDSSFDLNNSFEDIITQTTNNAIVFTIEETLNPGIKTIIEDLKKQNIEVKIISGDSMQSVSRIMQRLGLSTDRIVDLSENKENLMELVNTKDIFTRAKPEDKLTIIKALQATGNRVAMVGDGINDVLSLKASDVSIAMEGGSKIAREVSDIVLLNNDYQKIPIIFYEGENIIFNLKTTTKMFLAKSLFAIITAAYFSFQLTRYPLDPSSTLIFSFLGGSAPSYVLIFTRQKVTNTLSFFKDVLSNSIPAALTISAVFILFYNYLKAEGFNFLQINTSLIILLLSLTFVFSLYLVWVAKKLRSILGVIFFYILVMTIGTFQTLLPLNAPSRTNEELVILVGLLGIGFILLTYTVSKIINPKKTLVKALIMLICFGIIVGVSFFPFQNYYSVTSIPLDTHLKINAIGFLTIPIIAISSYIIRRIVVNKNESLS